MDWMSNTIKRAPNNHYQKLSPSCLLLDPSLIQNNFDQHGHDPWTFSLEPLLVLWLFAPSKYNRYISMNTYNFKPQCAEKRNKMSSTWLNSIRSRLQKFWLCNPPISHKVKDLALDRNWSYTHIFFSFQLHMIATKHKTTQKKRVWQRYVPVISSDPSASPKAYTRGVMAGRLVAGPLIWQCLEIWPNWPQVKQAPDVYAAAVGAACVPCATGAVCAACAAGAHIGHLMAYSDNSFKHDHTAHNHSNRNTLQNGGDDNAHNWVPQSDPMSSSVTAFFSDLGWAALRNFCSSVIHASCTAAFSTRSSKLV